jgi:Zn finger protein HypA/HybF involved in hydrogenase expression
MSTCSKACGETCAECKQKHEVRYDTTGPNGEMVFTCPKCGHHDIVEETRATLQRLIRVVNSNSAATEYETDDIEEASIEVDEETPPVLYCRHCRHVLELHGWTLSDFLIELRTAQELDRKEFQTSGEYRELQAQKRFPEGTSEDARVLALKVLAALEENLFYHWRAQRKGGRK